MARNFENPSKVTWLAGVSCHACGGEVNSWDKRCSRALGYKHITCEECIGKEYGVTIEERAKCAEADAEGARQETFAAKDQAEKLKAAFKTEEDLRKRAEQQVKEFLVAQDQNAKALDKAQKAADKAKADAEAARKRLESMKSDPAVIAELGGKAAEEAKQKAEEAFQTERDKLTAEAEKAAKAAEAAQTEAERLRKELTLASPEAAEFKLLFGQLQSTFNQAMDVLLKVKASNEEQAGKLRAAMSALLAAWTRKIGGGGE